MENLVVSSDPVAQIERNHRSNMKIYEQKFESNHFLFFHDLWEYVERKLATQDGATLFVHPLSDAQHPSASATDPNQAYLEIKMAN